MPHYLCWQCFNTAVDINAFIDSGISYQRSLVGELRPSQHDGAEVAPCDTVLPESVGSSQEEVLTEELVEEREIVLQAVGDQMQQVTGQTETAAGEENVHSKSQESQEDTDCSPEAREQHEDSTQEAEQGGTQAAQDRTQEAEQGGTQAAQDSTQAAAQDSTQVAQGGTQAAQGGTQAAQGGTQAAAQGGTQEAAQDSTQETEAPAPGSEREKCSYCSKTFRRPSQLKSHLARHSGARPHLCVVCGVAFKHRRNLVEHTHTHSQDPAFICAKCGLTFKQKSK
ncbi:Zinc finger and SCAN domain-containing protein 10 [Chionoecetes opilio]|uniref:Zinc finger and SCAN domain-containing protein 10 n=1 Tax=Chionoecetes opilio TaxID=41210 RepID=A0A8J4YKQ1_CHIOP|nr:Zinc finger and SCAN domain-containing protein 10 [Chionoecetes opilio]